MSRFLFVIVIFRFLKFKIIIHYSCEIDDFVETHFCSSVWYSYRAWCGVCVSVPMKQIRRQYSLELACTRVSGRCEDVLSLISLYADTAWYCDSVLGPLAVEDIRKGF